MGGVCGVAVAAPQKKEKSESVDEGHPEDHMHPFRSVSMPKGMSAFI